MLCQICGKRNANVHETRVLKVQGQSVTGAERHLCEVCAGIKTEVQFLEAEAARQQEQTARRERTREAGLALGQVVSQEIFAPRADIMQEKQLKILGSSVAPEWNLYLGALGSSLPEVDPLEALLGPSFQGINHAILQAGICEAHLILWDADPNILLRYLFEPFPDAGARFDEDGKTLLVERELELFPNPSQSISFCSLAGSLLNTCDREAAKENRYRFKLVKLPPQSNLPTDSR